MPLSKDAKVAGKEGKKTTLNLTQMALKTKEFKAQKKQDAQAKKKEKQKERKKEMNDSRKLMIEYDLCFFSKNLKCIFFSTSTHVTPHPSLTLLINAQPLILPCAYIPPNLSLFFIFSS